MSYCEVCGTDYLICKHHIKTRGSGGSDDDWNLISLCFTHHTEVHQIGLNKFANKYPRVEDWLKLNGHEFDSVMLKWTKKGASDEAPAK